MGEYKPTSTKTTYDPKVLPDSRVADMSSRAAVQAESLFKTNPALREASIKVDKRKGDRFILAIKEKGTDLFLKFGFVRILKSSG